MSDHQLYTVTLTDIGEYTVTVGASHVDEAKRIAQTVLLEEATTLPDGMAISSRKCEAVASLSEPQQAQTYEVSATYMLDFSMIVRATTRAEAEQHAKRLYLANAGPFEFTHYGDRVGPFHAREVNP